MVPIQRVLNPDQKFFINIALTLINNMSKQFTSTANPRFIRVRAVTICTAAALPALLLPLVFAAAQSQKVSPKLPTAVPIKVDFTGDIQPLLKAHCYQCHAGDQKQGGLRLDTKAFALTGGATGPGLVAGDAKKSKIIERLLGQDSKPKMPLGFAPLTDAQITLFKNWIDAGAVWPEAAGKVHWAYVPPIRPAVPKVKTAGWARTSIDNFILSRLEKEHVKPNPEADRTTLLRRVTFDLIGVPPTPEEVIAFVTERSPNAYEKVLDRLFASPHYGEKMALTWLDTARYADSNGYQQDGDTYQYVWRDWVVRAMNANMPFDQFTIEQLAGDLLPNATVDQKLATGFNRCNLLNGEGGAIAEEQRNNILFDRVDVTATAWLGATLACAQCHDHKYDPLTRNDYYSFMAYFNNVPESGTPSGGGQYRIAEPSLKVPAAEDSENLATWQKKLDEAKTVLAKEEGAPAVAAAQMAWEEDTIKVGAELPQFEEFSMAGPYTGSSFEEAYSKKFAPEMGLKPGPNHIDITDKKTWTLHPEYVDGSVYVLNGEDSSFYLYRRIHAERAAPLQLSFGSDDAIKVWFNGAQIVADKALRAALPDQDLATVQLVPGINELLIKIVNGGGIGGFYFKSKGGGVPADVIAAVKHGSSRTPAETTLVKNFYLANYAPPTVKTAREAVASADAQIAAITAALPRVMVMSDAMPRVTHVLLRGNYEMPGDVVHANTPASLPQMPPTAPKNRLGLAQWLVSPGNPLTARVQVNRYWQYFFGAGLVKTSENLGTQCDPPSHPALMDWLAVDFRESGWNVKRMQRMIVSSAAYRQSSKLTPAMRLKDPENRLVARAARFRLPSMILRDTALATSGLLDQRMGGKPVYPYQPKGIWDGLAITNERDFTYPQSKGTDLYRRSLYTFWRRTVAPSNMFDSSVRNTCKVRLTVTSTPLHALTMLNDATWVEAGRTMAQKMLQMPGTDSNAKLVQAFLLVCSRRPNSDELAVLRRSLNRGLAAYRADPKSATEYLKIGDSPRDEKIDPAMHAAFAEVCLAILNLDEAMTRE